MEENLAELNLAVTEAKTESDAVIAHLKRSLYDLGEAESFLYQLGDLDQLVANLDRAKQTIDGAIHVLQVLRGTTDSYISGGFGPTAHPVPAKLREAIAESRRTR